MSEFVTYNTLGFRHIADLNAADHILFLLALAAVYRMSEWRAALWVITAFTLGHSITLALAVTGLVTLPTQLIELLIPVTILATCIENVRWLRHERSKKRAVFRAALAGVFGLVHGAGFANYLKAMFVEQIAVPLLGFNIGIEMGQVVILFLAALTFVTLDRAIAAVPSRAAGTLEQQPFVARVVAVSAIVAVFATRMVIERSTW